MASAATTLKDVTMELGGKSPLIVFEDADIDDALSAAMLAEVQSFVQQKKPILFLGWAPHSMNERIDMTYLTGSTAETFGGDDGTATVWTNTRKGFEDDMPNVATFLKNFTFPVAMINQIMTAMHTQKGLSPRDAGLIWLKQHPDTYRDWLKNVTTTGGKPAAPAFEVALEGVKE